MSELNRVEEGSNGQWTDWKFEAENYKKAFEQAMKERNQLKDVIEEVRKIIIDYLITEDYCSGKCLDLADVVGNIFQILDKAKNK